jgi:hypothetical protein
MFVMFVTTEYLVYYRWLTNRYDCPVNVCSLYEACTTAGGCSVKKFLSVFVMGITKKPVLKVCWTEPVLELWYYQKRWIRTELKVLGGCTLHLV